MLRRALRVRFSADVNAETDRSSPEEAVIETALHHTVKQVCSDKSKVDKATEQCSNLSKAIYDLKSDFSLHCHAWLKMCGNVSTGSHAVAEFRSCATESQANADIKATARSESTGNELIRRVGDIQKTVELLKVGCNHKNDMIAVCEARPAADQNSR